MTTVIEVPKSCDTFVVMPDCTKGQVIFGKNSDRPNGEVQEIIYEASKDHNKSQVQCTYIAIDQVLHTNAVILSKPSWMWGAEMGANEFGVCIGNEAVFAKVELGDEERLLGMDLVRLGLERSSSAKEALDVITCLLEKYGQGGPCSDIMPEFKYHNSFLIVDANEAWVLETAGNLWVAEKITSGYRNISNCYSIEAKIDQKCANLESKLQELGLWDGISELNFKAIMETPGSDESRWTAGRALLTKHCSDASFSLHDMLSILRNERCGICLSDGMFLTTSSQVSVLVNEDISRPHCHWFTGTPDPQKSVFKPFIFTPNAKISPFIQSPKIKTEDDPAKVEPRFAKKIDRSHLLYRRHEGALADGDSDTAILKTLRAVEENCIKETEEYLSSFNPDRLSEVDDLFKDCVDSELKFYVK